MLMVFMTIAMASVSHSLSLDHGTSSPPSNDTEGALLAGGLLSAPFIVSAGYGFSKTSRCYTMNHPLPTE